MADIPPWKRLENIAYMLLKQAGCTAMPSCVSRAEVNIERDGKQFDALGFHKDSGLMVLVECKERRDKNSKISGQELNNFFEKVRNYNVDIGWIISSTNRTLESHLSLETLDEKYRANLQRIENNPNALVLFDWKNKSEKFITMWGYSQLFDYRNISSSMEKMLFPYATIKRIQNLPFKKNAGANLEINSADFGLKNLQLDGKDFLIELLDVLDVAYIRRNSAGNITELREKPINERVKNTRVLGALYSAKKQLASEIYLKLMDSLLLTIKSFNDSSPEYRINAESLMSDVRKMYSFEHMITQ